MRVVLLDTTVATLLHPKKKGTEIRDKYEKHMRGHTLALSFQSVAELWHWAEKNAWGEKARQGLDSFVRRFLVIPYDHELAQIWARVMEESRKKDAASRWGIVGSLPLQCIGESLCSPMTGISQVAPLQGST